MMQPRLKLATYNIHRCFGTDNRFNPDRISGVIKQLGADIIALQEVESFAEDGRDILNNFGNLGYIAIPGPTMYQRNSTYGNAVLTRHCPEGIEKIDISLPDVEPRGALSLVYAFNELRLHVVATHLGLRFRERLFQIESLARIIKHHSADITVLMGDFNEWLPFGRISRLLPHRFGTRTKPATYPSRFPLFALDQIWARPDNCIRETRKLATPLSRIASDHLPLTATINLKIQEEGSKEEMKKNIRYVSL
jgi:endonuclease/exonuclease/phosphatase family metal-dependent hydrolase